MNVVTVQCIIAAASVAFLITSTNACSSSNIMSLSSSSPSLFGGGTKVLPPSMTVPLTMKDVTLTGRVAVGTPRRGGNEEVFTLAINLFSPTTWLHSVEMCPGGDCDKAKFKAVGGLKSNTFQRKHNQIQLYMQLDFLKGYISEEKFKFGSGKGAPEAVLEFLEITDKSFGTVDYDGVLGLGFQDANGFSHAPVAASLFTQFKDAMFGIQIYKVPKNEELGLMTIGGNDAAYIDGALYNHDVVIGGDGKLSGWNIYIDQLLIINTDGTREDQKLSTNIASPAPALKGISLPRQEYIKLTNIILQKAGFAHNDRSFSCQNNLNALPSVALVMDGVEYVFTPEEYVRHSGRDDICVLAFEYDRGNKMLLGQVFMEKYYTRFNIRDMQVQFAKAKQGPTHRDQKKN